VIARRTEKHLSLTAGKRVERWRRIAREASEQARRVTPPEISEPVKLSAALDTTADFRIVLAESEREVQFADLLHELPELRPLGLAIGPEGGWAAEELHLFTKAGWVAASLGDTILRSETAAIAALAIARAEIA
jgi:16S rRNA (uracil1498-N3)-methyltransferase